MNQFNKTSSYLNEAELYQAIILLATHPRTNEEAVKCNSELTCIHSNQPYIMAYGQHMLINAVYPYVENQEASFILKMVGRNNLVDLTIIPPLAWLNLEPKQVIPQSTLFSIETNVKCLLSVQFQRPI